MTSVDLEQPLWISEFFYSLQGEGSRQGRPCAFVRLAGCNLSCAWCDATYTWKPGVMQISDKRRFTVAEALATVTAYGVPFIEVTGGEPLLQRGVYALLTALCDRGHEVIVDTSGSLSVADVDPRVAIVMDLKCPSSGQSERMDWTNLARLRPGRDEVKFVIADRTDYEWALSVGEQHKLFGRLPVILSPAASAHWLGDMADWPLPAQLARWIIEDRCPAVLQLQLHRLLWPEAVRGQEEGALRWQAGHEHTDSAACA